MAYEVEATSELAINGRPLGIINATDGLYTTPDLAATTQMRQLASQLSRWVDNARAAGRRTNMFDRGVYTPPNNPYDEMRAAWHAVKYDSVVSGVAEITEAVAFQGVKWEGQDADDADVFNQMSRDQNLDQVVRSMWREEFAIGQFVAAKMWGWKTYTVRGKTKKGNKRKKVYRVWCPTSIRILNSRKVVPVDHGPLGGSRLAWQAGPGEVGHYQAAVAGDVIDPLMVAFFDGEYRPRNMDEAADLQGLGVDYNSLLLLDEDWVFRHTITKSDYERFADIRLKSCFHLLDMKNQLMASDRATLIGSANYILLVKKGDNDRPATPEEMANLVENYNVIAKMPVIISDHRLNIELIAPKIDLTLDGDKYETLNNQILSRLLGTLSIGGRGQRNETQVTLSSIVGRVMENRRHMLKRALEKEIARAVIDHPKNEGLFDSEPNLVYVPRNVSLDFNNALIQGLLSLRTQREISRETILEYFGLDQETEAQRMEIEEEFFDDIFQTQIPFAAPGAGGAPKGGPNGTPVAPGVSGGQGGRPAGGGAAKKSPAKQSKPKTAGGNSTKAALERPASRVCPGCQDEVFYDELDGYQRADGSVSHDDGSTHSDHIDLEGTD